MKEFYGEGTTQNRTDEELRKKFADLERPEYELNMVFEILLEIRRLLLVKETKQE